MKKLLYFLSFMMIAQSAFSITNKELTAKVLSDDQFIGLVEQRIRGIFKKPASVKLEFSFVKAQMDKGSQFEAYFEYEVDAGSVSMGLCNFTVSGSVADDSTLVFGKMIHEDCGE